MTELEEVKQKILPILKQHDVKKASLFGSLVRKENTEDSDIDILVEIDDSVGLLDFIKIKIELEEALGRKVDLVEYSTVKPRLKEYINKEQVAIL